MRVTVDCIPGVDVCQFAVYVTSEPGSGVTVHWLPLLFPHMSGLPLGSCCCCCCRCSVSSHLCQIQPGLWWCQVALSHLYALFVFAFPLQHLRFDGNIWSAQMCSALTKPALNRLTGSNLKDLNLQFGPVFACKLLLGFCFWGHLIVASTT